MKIRSRMEGSKFKVQGSKFKVQSSRFKVQSSKFKVQGSKQSPNLQHLTKLDNSFLHLHLFSTPFLSIDESKNNAEAFRRRARPLARPVAAESLRSRRKDNKPLVSHSPRLNRQGCIQALLRRSTIRLLLSRDAGSLRLTASPLIHRHCRHVYPSQKILTGGGDGRLDLRGGC